MGSVLRVAVAALALVSTVAHAKVVKGPVGIFQKKAPKGKLADDPRFKDPLPIPPRIVVPAGHAAELVIPMTHFKATLYKDLPVTDLWGYGGVTPVATIEVESGTKLTVHWTNNLPKTHFLKAVPPPMPMPMPVLPDVRAVVHLHGAMVDQPSIPTSSTTTTAGRISGSSR